jgi:SAM-dependent methyltransferase
MKPGYRKDPGFSMRGLSTLFALAGLATLASAPRIFTSFTAAKPVLDAERGSLPPELKNPNAAKWSSWAQKQDTAIRARLDQGDLDSMVNLLLLGTSFTKQPRVTTVDLTGAARSGVLRARVDDMVAGFRMPAGNERLVFLRGLLDRRGIDPQSPAAGQFLYDNLLRMLQEQRDLAARAAETRQRNANAEPTKLLDRESVFATRGVSLDTGILPNFAIEQALRDLKARGVLGEGQLARVAVVGPGLDFIDKNDEAAYDYYPQQTLQPFALYDSILRLNLARTTLSMSILDISPRVLEHFQHALDRAKNDGYTVQLARDNAWAWPEPLVSFWTNFGDKIGTSVAPLKPPAAFPTLATRAVRVRPDVVLACEAIDLNIVVERLNLPEKERFDLIVGTNIFVYYDAFQQALALENAGAMLKPGGLLLTNDRLPVVPGGLMREAGTTEIRYNDQGAREAIGWYQRN